MMAQIIDLKNKRPGEEKLTGEEKVEQNQTNTSPRPEVLIAQSVHPERSREGTSQTKQDAERVRGFVRDTERVPNEAGRGTSSRLRTGRASASYVVHRRLGTDTDEIAWTGPLSLHQPNVRNITITAAIFFALAVLIQVFDGNLITTVFFALLGGVILIHAGKEPKNGRVEINPTAIIIDSKPHRYNDIRSFWIEYDLGLGIKELSLQLKRWHAPYIKIPLTDQNPVQIRAYLLQFLPEEEHKDTLADVLARKLGI